jgi:hypothetical protein
VYFFYPARVCFLWSDGGGTSNDSVFLGIFNIIGTSLLWIILLLSSILLMDVPDSIGALFDAGYAIPIPGIGQGEASS